MRWRPSAIQIEFALLLVGTIAWLGYSVKYLLSYLVRL